eukprot:scaffold48415_cov61-Phaeocystis_antarctica.AAC.1
MSREPPRTTTSTSTSWAKAPSIYTARRRRMVTVQWLASWLPLGSSASSGSMPWLRLWLGDAQLGGQAGAAVRGGRQFRRAVPHATVTCTSATATLWGLQRSKFQGIQQLTAMDVQAKMVSALETDPDPDPDPNPNPDFNPHPNPNLTLPPGERLRGGTSTQGLSR